MAHDARFVIRAEEYRPAYRALLGSGELARRVEQALAGLEVCQVCPRLCGINRLEDEVGVCRTGRYARISSYFPHPGEENPLRGWRGSGTIFFVWCNLRCVFCQNFEISQSAEGRTETPERIARMMLDLQEQGCHNINFVTPEHVVPQMLEALQIAAQGGLNLPIVYNTSAYDSLESLHLLDGVVDIYMPDFKIWDPALAKRYLKAEDYPEVARAAIREMHRQVGDLLLDERGIARRGLLLRHLVMPGGAAGTPEVARWLAEDVSRDTYINLMAQYHPAGRVGRERYPELNRRITHQEYREAYQAAQAAGLWRFDERPGRTILL